MFKHCKPFNFGVNRLRIYVMNLTPLISRYLVSEQMCYSKWNNRTRSRWDYRIQMKGNQNPFKNYKDSSSPIRCNSRGLCHIMSSFWMWIRSKRSNKMQSNYSWLNKKWLQCKRCWVHLRRSEFSRRRIILASRKNIKGSRYWMPSWDSK